MMRRRMSAAAFAAVAAIALVQPGISAADDGSNPLPEKTEHHVVDMVARGFDHEVARANGFKIVKDKNGKERSVPVTKEAKELLRKANLDDSSMQPMDEVPGRCGTAHVYATKRANDQLSVSTGYTLAMSVIRRDWWVEAVGALTTKTFPFHKGPTAASWSGQGAGTVVGPGLAAVPPTAYATMQNGTKCWSQFPTDPFG